MLTENYLSKLKTYLKKYQKIHDESFLSNEEIAQFKLSEKNPTYLLLHNKEIKGVLSFMMDDYFLKCKKARIRIFHCESSNSGDYEMLIRAYKKDIKIYRVQGVEKLELFMPDKNEKVIEILKKLSFKYYRTSYVMIRKPSELENVKWPTDYKLKNFRVGIDETNYAAIRNKAFKNLKGSTTPIDTNKVKALLNSNDSIENGIKILFYKNKPIGLVRVIKEVDEDKKYSFIAPIALIPKYQKRGLGTKLLLSAINIGIENGFDSCMLVVNAENDNALKLYKKTGFRIDEAVSCFVLNN